MKRIAFVGFIASFFVLCFMKAFLFAVSVDDWTFTNDYDSVPCSYILPTPMETFDARVDNEMCMIVLLKDVYAGDTDQFKWYYGGELYTQQTLFTFTQSGYLCHGTCLDIRNTERENMTGYWSVEVYLNGVLSMTENFYLAGLNTSITTTSYSTDPCLMSLLYGEYSEETELLRYFRDTVLSQTPEGRALIKLYYLWSPTIVRAMEGNEEFTIQVKELMDNVLPMIQ